MKTRSLISLSALVWICTFSTNAFAVPYVITCHFGDSGISGAANPTLYSYHFIEATDTWPYNNTWAQGEVESGLPLPSVVFSSPVYGGSIYHLQDLEFRLTLLGTPYGARFWRLDSYWQTVGYVWFNGHNIYFYGPGAYGSPDLQENAHCNESGYLAF